MNDRVFGTLRHFTWPFYFVALLLVVTPLVDLAANIGSVRVNDVSWRYGTSSLLSGFLLTPLFGLLLAILVAAMAEHRLTQRVLAVLNVGVGVVLAGLTVLLLLDWLQVRASMDPDTRDIMDIGSVKAAGKLATVALALVWIGVMGVRASRGDAGARARPATPLVRPRSD